MLKVTKTNLYIKGRTWESEVVYSNVGEAGTQWNTNGVWPLVQMYVDVTLSMFVYVNLNVVTIL